VQDTVLVAQEVKGLQADTVIFIAIQRLEAAAAVADLKKQVW
jgi:hypothetical protein